MPLEMERIMYRIFIDGLAMTSDNDQLSKEENWLNFSLVFFSLKILPMKKSACKLVSTKFTTSQGFTTARFEVFLTEF